MKGVLTILEGAGKGTTKPLNSALMIVGRSKNADLLVDDPLVSRRHLEIRVESDAVFVENKSTQGSMLNGKPLTGIVSLNPGDVIEVGNTKMRFEESAEPAPQPKRSADPMEAEIDGTRIADSEALPPPKRKEAEADETRAMADDGTRMLNPSELPNWQAQAKIEKKAADKSGTQMAIIGCVVLVVIIAVCWFVAGRNTTGAGSTLIYKDSLYDFSLEHPLDWSKTADDSGVIGFGVGREDGNNWSRVNIYTDKSPDFESTGLTDGFAHYQDVLNKRYPGFGMLGHKKINVNGATVLFYEFNNSDAEGRGIYMLNDDTRIVVECVGSRATYSQNTAQYTSILKSFQFDQYAVQQFIDFPLPDESMQQLALSNPTELSNEVDTHIQNGKIYYQTKDVSPENLYKSIEEYQAALQLSLAPPQRLPAYDTAAEGLADATREFNHALDQQRFEITSALKEGDLTRAYWGANKMMQMIPDKTDPAYQEAYKYFKALPKPKRPGQD